MLETSFRPLPSTGTRKTPDMPASSAVVLKLAEPILDHGNVIYVDNRYKSPYLKAVLDRKTHNIGTAYQTRMNMPEEFGKPMLENKCV